MNLPDVLALGAGIATELIERTSSTPNTLRALQLSLAPAFLLVGIGSIMNVMMKRLTWVAGRIERLSQPVSPLRVSLTSCSVTRGSSSHGRFQTHVAESKAATRSTDLLQGGHRSHGIHLHLSKHHLHSLSRNAR